MEADLAHLDSLLLPTSPSSPTSHIQKLVGNETSTRGSIYATYGSSVAFSEDGNTLVVGAPSDSTDASGANSVTQAGAAFVYIRSGGTWVLQQKLVGIGTNGRNISDVFGYSVAISGNTIVVGAPQQGYDENGANFVSSAGAAFVFTRTSGVWSLQQKLVGSGLNGRDSLDWFGFRVAISGDTIAVSATQHDYDENGANPVTNAGAAYIFTRSANVWSPQQKLVGVGTNGRVAGDNFGYGVAVSGETVVVGSPNQDYDENGATSLADAGAAYVFTRSVNVWSLQQKLVASGPNGRMLGDALGGNVAISGETVVASAYRQNYDEGGNNSVTDAGAAYVFTRSANIWSQQQKLVASGTNARNSNDFFGYSIGISGDTVVVGAPQQDYDTNGANYVLEAGAAFVFTRSANVWNLQQKLVGNGTNARMQEDVFGYSVAASGDTIVVGAAYHDYDESGSYFMDRAGAAFVSARSAGIWTQQIKLVDSSIVTSRSPLGYAAFGLSSALSEDGKTLVIGAPYDSSDQNNTNFMAVAGAAYVFVKNGDTWSLQQKLVAVGTNGRNSSDQFGYSVAISGNTIVVGVPSHYYDESGANSVSSAGAAYVFTRSSNVWSLQQKLVGSGTNGRKIGDQFGRSVAISGETLVIGVPYQGYDENGANLAAGAGAAYVFTRSLNVWSLQQKLVGSGTNGRVISDNFGNNVAISNETIVVGAAFQDYDENGANSASNAGAAYVFTRSLNVWSLQQKLVGSGTNGRVANDEFGTSISISGDSLVVGAIKQDYDENGDNSVIDAGAAYVFTRSSNSWSLQQKLVGSGNNGRMADDQFGGSVSLSGDGMVIGVYRQDSDENGDNSIAESGAAYTFSRSSSVWSLGKKLVGNGTNGRITNDYFGASVALSGTTAVIGAPFQDYDENGSSPSSEAGAIWIYDLLE